MSTKKKKSTESWELQEKPKKKRGGGVLMEWIGFRLQTYKSNQN